MPYQYKKRIVVADRLAIMRVGLCAVLAEEPGLVVVGEAAESQSLLQAVSELSPDGVLMDASLAGPSFLYLIREIKRLRPTAKVALFAGAQPRERVMEGLRAGVDGYIAKVAGTSELGFALMSILNGQTYLSPEVSGQVIESHLEEGSGRATPPGCPHLSRREQEVLRLVAAGRTSREIAGQLFISSRTVEKHRAAMMRKLGLPHMAALLSYAITNGFAEGEIYTQLLQRVPAGFAALSVGGLLA